jgi:CTP synthase (UTP-ammonia lyase)
MTPIRIGIIGDFNPDYEVHRATNESIQHSAHTLGQPAEAVWLSTDKSQQYERFQGLICAPGSPYRSFEGALVGIRYAREHGVPFVGTCGGFQHLVIEYARNVMGFTDAAHAETDPYASRLVVTPLSCSLVGKTMEVTITPDTQAARVFRGLRSTEAFYCNFGLNPAYGDELQTAGLRISGRDQNGEARIVELPAHPFFIGTLFVPQARSTVSAPHPLILEFCRATLARSPAMA